MATEVDPLAFQKGFAATQSIFDNARQNRLQMIAAQRAEDEYQQGQAANRLLAAAVGPDGTIDRNKALTGYAQAGLGSKIPALQTQFATQDKAKREADKAALEQHMQVVDIASRTLSGVKDQAGLDQARAYLATIAPEGAATLPTVYDATQIGAIVQRGLSLKDHLTQQLQRDQFGETRRHNQATEGLTAQGHQLTLRGQNMTAETARQGQQVTMRGQDMINQRALETGQVTRDAKTQEQLDKKVNAFSTQLDKTNIPQFESLLSDIEAEIARYQKGDIPGYGWSGQLPQFALTDEGKRLRQKIATLQNLTLKDRSGAAVTNQELQRLLNELGTGVLSSDDQLRSGLTNVRRQLDATKRNVVAGVDDATLREYEARGGLPLARGAQPAQQQPAPGGGAKRVSSKAEYDALPSGALYTDPNGVTRRKS